MCTLLYLLLGSENTIMRLLTRLGQRRFPLHIPLLQLLFAHLKDFSLGVA